MAERNYDSQSSKKSILVIASRNRGKVAEFSALLEGLGIEVRGLADFAPIEEVAEDGDTFSQNAIKKALTTARELHLPAIADDSGLVVNALGGLPGVRSARYAGENATDQANNEKLLASLRGIKDRSATFVCVIAAAAPDRTYRLYEGRCDGIIAERPMGEGGFGYDPLFYYPPLGKTFAQMETEEKNAVSHRGKAVRLLLGDSKSLLKWLLPEAASGR